MILRQEPKEGLYICVNNKSDQLNLLEDTNRKIAVGTPLLFLKRTDSDEYLFQDAEGHHLKMYADSINRYLRKAPNRVPNCIEKLMCPILEYDGFHSDLSHTEFILPAVPVSSAISAIFALAAFVMGFLNGSANFITIVVFGLLPYMFTLAFFLLKRKIVCGEFLYILKSPYRVQLVTELRVLLDHNEMKEQRDD